MTKESCSLSYSEVVNKKDRNEVRDIDVTVINKAIIHIIGLL